MTDLVVMKPFKVGAKTLKKVSKQKFCDLKANNFAISPME